MYLIVTNNPMAAKEFAGQGEVRLYPEDTYREILVRARDLVYIGHRLCNHPLYGSLRPHETPYRTVVLSDRPQTPDEEECLIMSEAITRIDTFTPPDRAKMPQRILEDYQMIDCSLVRNTFAFSEGHMKNAGPPRTPMCPGRFISAVDGVPAYAVGTARGNI